jgi:hypothetical protein
MDKIRGFISRLQKKDGGDQDDKSTHPSSIGDEEYPMETRRLYEGENGRTNGKTNGKPLSRTASGTINRRSKIEFIKVKWIYLFRGKVSKDSLLRISLCYAMWSIVLQNLTCMLCCTVVGKGHGNIFF